MNINSEALVEQIESSIKDMKKMSFLEEDRFAIHNNGNIQVQIVLTRDDQEYLDLCPGIVD